jgi:hypothetical protein
VTATGIDIRAAERGYALRDRRADITPLLRTRTPEAALRLIPTLLPICAEAQHIAAQRAVAAALDRREDEATAARYGRRLCREQVLACAWRLLVDWPRVLGRAVDAQRLRGLRRLEDAELSRALCALLPGLDAVACTDDLRRWAAGRHCVGAEMAARAMGTQDAAARVTLLADEALWQEALREMGCSGARRRGARNGSAIAVGPLALGRHELVPALARAAELPLRARLLHAMLLDTLALAEALRGNTREEAAQQKHLADAGVGRALTARGPLFHRVRLDAGGRVADWQLLSPTDWHVADDGLLAVLLHRDRDAGEVALSVSAVDPCAPWSLAGAPTEAPSHA